jgi:SAM-dependent methyltransferase
VAEPVRATGGPIANTAMAAAWDGDEGERWARDWARYDRSVAGYHGRLLAAAALAATDRVLDVGCGNGQTTRDAARTAVDGWALGVDLSARMLERAEALARRERVANVRFERADAQVHPFPAGTHDVAISRFGATFFADPVAAFANIAATLAPGGRLAVVGWRGLADNEWLRCVRDALAVGRDLPAPPAGAPGPFGLADPVLARERLAAAGFVDVDVTALDEPFVVGVDGPDATAFLRGTGVVRGLGDGLDERARARAFDALAAAMAARETGRGVELGSGAWLYTARRPAR